MRSSHFLKIAAFGVSKSGEIALLRRLATDQSGYSRSRFLEFFAPSVEVVDGVERMNRPRVEHGDWFTHVVEDGSRDSDEVVVFFAVIPSEPVLAHELKLGEVVLFVDNGAVGEAPELISFKPRRNHLVGKEGEQSLA